MVVLEASKQEGKMEGRGKIILVAQEITFAKSLASNDLRLRNRAIRKLRKWLQNRAEPNQETPFTRDDMLRLWKGLFYCMWMSDKPLVQEELAENICSLVHCLIQQTVALNFVEAFFLTMREEWFNIDTFRLNKFQMLVRRMLRQALALVAKKQWGAAPQLADIIWRTVLKDEISRPPPLGLGLHVCEIFIEELAKVSGSTGISQKALTTLLSAFARCLASKAADARLRTTVCSEVFGQLIKQTDAGLEHQEKVEAWRRMGCPAIPLDQLERMEIDQEEADVEEEQQVGEEEEKALDPRAGQLDVELPQIPFNPTQVASMLRKFISDPGTNAKAKRRLKFVAQKFADLNRGKYPLSFKVPLTGEDEDLLEWDPEDDVDAAAEDLQRFEEQLAQEEVEMGIASNNITKRVKANQMDVAKTRKRKHRRKPSWNVTTVTEETNGEAKAKAKSPESRSPGTRGQWQVSPVNEKEKAQKKAVSAAWSEPLKDGEYEYFVEPRKNKNSDKKLGKKRRSLRMAKTANKEETSPQIPENKQISPKANKFISTKQETTVNTMINGSIDQMFNNSLTTKVHVSVSQQKVSQGTPVSPQTPVGKKRTLPDNNMCTPLSALSKKSRISLTGLTGSGKRVDFQLKHNKFQELHQHVEQIRNSPGVPHDPNKKPVKGLLKPSTPTPSPIIIKKRGGGILFG